MKIQHLLNAATNAATRVSAPRMNLNYIMQRVMRTCIAEHAIFAKKSCLEIGL
jgi:hypothetical protein